MGTSERLGRHRQFAAIAGFLIFAILLFGHFLLERRSHTLVALHLGEPLRGTPVPPIPAPTAATPLSVWIDTDAGCGSGSRVDVDDCFAIVTALGAPEIDVQGISTVFGNVPRTRADSVLADLLAVVRPAGGVPRVYHGASVAGKRPTQASEAIARGLASIPAGVTILALGPLTNVAAALEAHPELVARVQRVVAVAGKRPGQWMHPGYDHMLTFEDFNIAKDPDAARSVLDAGVPVMLVPFEAALAVTITVHDLDTLARSGATGTWLRARSLTWLALWRNTAGRDGFVPFDQAAALALLEPSLLPCVEAFAQLERSPPWFGIGWPRELAVRRDSATDRRRVRYCAGARPAFHQRMMARLLAAVGEHRLSPRRIERIQ